MTDVVALDGMGVLYRDGNIVNRLLVPYLRRIGCHEPPETIRGVYHACSRGDISTDELWASLGVSGAASDDEYCQSHTLTPGLIPALTRLTASGITLACLTNDTSVWSAILRKRFELEQYISHWYVSADIGIRKPDPRAYDALLRGVGVPASKVLYVDDRGTNLLPAHAAGMRTILFSSDDTDGHPVPPHQTRVHTMTELATAILG